MNRTYTVSLIEQSSEDIVEIHIYEVKKKPITAKNKALAKANSLRKRYSKSVSKENYVLYVTSRVGSEKPFYLDQNGLEDDDDNQIDWLD